MSKFTNWVGAKWKALPSEIKYFMLGVVTTIVIAIVVKQLW